MIVKALRRTRLAHNHESPAVALKDAALALAELDRWIDLGSEAGTDDPFVLSFAPVANQNPYQSLLYSSAWRHGVVPVGVHEFSALLGQPWPGARVAHFHWLSPVLASVTTAEAAHREIEVFTQLLDDLKEEGVKILWTLHNVLPHDTPFLEEHCELRKILVDRADVIHLMAEAAIRAAKPYFEVPTEKALLSPHPSYVGVYPDYVSRESARHELGLLPTDFVFLFFGPVAPYKGIEDLVEAFVSLADRVTGRSRRPKLVIAGHQDAAVGEDATQRLIRTRSDIVRDNRRIPTEEVQFYFRAADVAVLPYRRMLNSGTAFVAATFGVPTLVPATQPVVEALGGAALFFQQNLPDSLRCVMERAMGEDLERYRTAAAHLAAENRPERVSDVFFTQLRARLCPSTDLNLDDRRVSNPT
jgi:beta-1,4-mannosyltransferase